MINFAYNIISFIFGALISRYIVKIKNDKVITNQNNEITRIKSNMESLSKIDEIKRIGKSFDNYLKKHDYKTIAIYGMGVVGKRVYDELKNSQIIEVKYGIEKINYNIESELEVKMFRDEELPRVDAIIITTVHQYDFVIFELDAYVDDDCDLISIKEILADLVSM